MNARVRLPEMLRRYADGAATVEVAGGTVADALADLFRRHPDVRPRVVGPDGRVFSYLVLLRNEREVPRESALDAPLADGDVLEIVGAAEGG